MVSQRRAVKEVDLYSKTAEKFLNLKPACCLPDVSDTPPDGSITPDRVSQTSSRSVFSHPDAVCRSECFFLPGNGPILLFRHKKVNSLHKRIVSLLQHLFWRIMFYSCALADETLTIIGFAYTWCYGCMTQHGWYYRDQNGFRPKSLKARNAGLGGVCTCLLNEAQTKHPLPRGVRGSNPRNFLASGVANGAFQCHFGSMYSNTPTPFPSKNISLQIYTDLKKKVWNQTKVWKFWSLVIIWSDLQHVARTFKNSVVVCMFSATERPCNIYRSTKWCYSGLM